MQLASWAAWRARVSRAARCGEERCGEARARGKARAPRGAGRSCRRSAAWRSEREGSVRAQRRRARGGRGRAARVEVGVETARAQRTGDGGVELPGTTAPAPASRGCRCTQSPRRRCRPERVTSPRAGEERARRGRGVASPCRTSRTSCHERRPSSRRRLTLRLILTGRMFFQRQRFSWGGAAVGNGIFEAERRCIHNCCVRIWAHQRLLIGNLCKFDHCAVGLVVEGGGVPDLRRHGSRWGALSEGVRGCGRRGRGAPRAGRAGPPGRPVTGLRGARGGR